MVLLDFKDFLLEYTSREVAGHLNVVLRRKVTSIHILTSKSELWKLEAPCLTSRLLFGCLNHMCTH